MPGRVFHQGNASFWIVHDCTKVAHSNTINTMVFKHLHFDQTWADPHFHVLPKFAQVGGVETQLAVWVQLTL